MADAAPQTIERISPIPYYEQLFTILAERIASGSITEEERLPSEHELCEEFGLSRATVRQTLAKLVSEGYAQRVPRRGVFAILPGSTPNWVVQDTEGFLDSQIHHGRDGVTTEVLGAGPVAPPGHVARALGTSGGEKVFSLVRLRSLNGAPALRSTNWLPGGAGRVVAEAEDVLAGRTSLNATLAEAGYVITGARRVIHALPAPADVAQNLGVESGHPLLRISSTSWGTDCVAFDYYETWTLTDTVPLEINVGSA